MGDNKSSYYEVLNIPTNASADEIRRAYKSLVRKWHPDKNPPASKLEAETMFKAITEAYEALSGGGGPVQESCSMKLPREPVVRRTGSSRPAGDSGSVFYTRKPPPIELKMECSLEELFGGCRKEVRYTRDVVGRNGLIIRKEEVQTVKVKPGMRKGHKIILEEKGDERPGSAPSDVIISISEKEHPHFKRVHSDLVLKVEIPLVNALAGWTFSFRHLNGEKMTCSLEEEVVFPGYEKVIKGEGMPVTGQKGVRGDLRIKFGVIFPRNLSKEQRAGIRALLKGCT